MSPKKPRKISVNFRSKEVEHLLKMTVTINIQIRTIDQKKNKTKKMKHFGVHIESTKIFSNFIVYIFSFIIYYFISFFICFFI